MSGYARITDAEALRSLRSALASFTVKAEQAVGQAGRALQQTQEWLAERRGYWEAEVMRREMAYHACISYRDADGYGRDCSWEAAALRQAQLELANVRRWVQAVDQVGQSYTASARKFESMVQNESSQAGAFLDRAAMIVERYSSGGGSTGGGQSSAFAAAGLTATGGGMAASGPAGTGSASSTGQAYSGSAGLALPSYNANAGIFSDAPLDEVETPQFAPGEWQQADVTDMRHSFSRLPEIRQAIDGGYIDKLVASDPDAARIYSWFYGTESVKLAWYQGQYTITNGKHRVALARMLGLPNVPATVWKP